MHVHVWLLCFTYYSSIEHSDLLYVYTVHGLQKPKGTCFLKEQKTCTMFLHVSSFSINLLAFYLELHLRYSRSIL